VTAPATAADVEGWLTAAQAARLASAAGGVPAGGRIVEIGSYRGRSTIVLAGAAAPDAEVVAIDPHLGRDRAPQQRVEDADLGEQDVAAFRGNLERAGVSGRVRHVRRRSEEALGAVDGGIDLLYVDGAHSFRFARFDIAHWGDRVVPGGLMLVHDSFSSVGVTLALLRTTFTSPRWRYEGRAGSLATFRRADLRGPARVRDALRQAAALPWFVRNLAVKALIVARLRPLARLLGHRHGPWPY
jgi:predicted O-methyltransferase YrrM